MNLEFRLLDENGDEVAPLPDIESFSLSPILADRGAVELTYPRGGKNWELIEGLDEFRLGVLLNGERQPRLDSIVQQVDGDDIGDAPWKFTGQFSNGRLSEAMVYPKNWPTVDPLDTKQRFSTATPGTIVKTLVQQAQTRGTLAGITTSSFTATTDSNGDTWAMVLSVEYAPQLDYLEMLRNLYDQRLAEFEMYGDDLHLYNFEANATDLTLGSTPLVFRRGRDLTDSPRKLSSRDLGTVMLAAGTEGLYVERVDAPGVASRRRIERKASQGQVTDVGTLTTLADAELSRVSSPQMEKTHGLTFTEGSPLPITDFDTGDWAYSDMGAGLERLRVKQWVIRRDAAGQFTGSVSLNDLFAEQNEVLSRRIQGIVGGSTITGGSQARETIPSDLVDGLAPGTPSAPTLASLAYMDDQGHTFAQVSASWLAVITNSDGTALEDLDGYRVRWKYSTESTAAWRIVDAGNTTSTSWSPVTPDVDLQVQVQAYDRAGNSGAWSTSGSVHTGFDATPPEAPSTPLVDVYLGLLRVRWDGKTASGAALAPDFNYVEVHVSNTNGFTPNRNGLPPTTLIDTVGGVPVGGGTSNSYAKLPYGTTWYAKLVAVDHSGNASTPSAQGGPATTTPVVSLDIFDGAVGSAKLADLAVTTAKINDLAVNNAKIGDVSAGKISAGIILSDVTVSGRFTTALTGQRVELNGIGIQAWNSSGTQTISLNGVSNLLTGEFKTAITGRRIEMGSGGLLGEINFYAPDGKTAFVRAYTQATGVEAIQLGLAISGATSPLWNRFNVNSDEFITGRSGTWELMYRITEGFRIYSIASGNTGASAWQRFALDADGAHFTFDTGTTARGWLNIEDHGINDAHYRSPNMAVVTDNSAGGGNWGCILKFVMLSDTSDWGYQVRNISDSGFERFKASAFETSSSRLVKRDIRLLDARDADLVGKLKATRPRRYRRQQSQPGIEMPEEIGLIAEEAPAEITSGHDLDTGAPFIDLYQMSTFLWATLQQVVDRLELLEAR